MFYITTFFGWTLYLYCLHRVAHSGAIPFLRRAHMAHHAQIRVKGTTHWHWTNLFLFTDTWAVTRDMWVTEIIPTVIFALIFDCYWLLVLYYVWAAFLQEPLEHNPKLNIWPFTAGQWHLEHHKNVYSNYGLFFPTWDKLFKTEAKVDSHRAVF
jgi:sterol desaturase/sphingolipid hydroxylase (fatty acid hydroxylase superfamily)